MKNKLIIFIVAAILIIVFVANGGEIGSPFNSSINDKNSHLQGTNLDSSNEDSKDKSSVKNDLNDSEGSDNGSTGDSNNNSSQSTRQNSKPTYPEFSLEDIKNENAQNQQNKNPSYTLPYTIPGTGIEIEKIGDYSGIFIEDGSDSEISNVATILLKNITNKDIELINIEIDQDQSLSFQASSIPAGNQVVVQEISGKPFTDSTITSISGSASDGVVFDNLDSEVSIKDNGDNSLTVKNISSKSIPTLRVFYKFYSNDDNAYIGGITYNSKINNLKPGAEEIIYPSHYISDSSKITMVKAYQEEQ